MNDECDKKIDDYLVSGKTSSKKVEFLKLKKTYPSKTAWGKTQIKNAKNPTKFAKIRNVNTQKAFEFFATWLQAGLGL